MVRRFDKNVIVLFAGGFSKRICCIFTLSFLLGVGLSGGRHFFSHLLVLPKADRLEARSRVNLENSFLRLCWSNVTRIATKHQLLPVPVSVNELLYRWGAKTIVSRQALTGAN